MSEGRRHPAGLWVSIFLADLKSRFSCIELTMYSTDYSTNIEARAVQNVPVIINKLQKTPPLTFSLSEAVVFLQSSSFFGDDDDTH